MPELDWTVFTATRPGVSRGIPPGQGGSLQWVANSATLIVGRRDAVLVDTFLTVGHNATLAEAVAATGKNLTHIYVTHGHGDHFFGINVLKERFPNVRAVATAAVVARMAGQLEPGLINGFWRRLFPGQIAIDPGMAEPLDGAIELEGHALVPVAAGFTDTADSTVLHVPSRGLVVAGDVVYNGIHPYLAETTAGSLCDWLAALDTLAALEPTAVVAGHKVPGNDDDPRAIAETRQYLSDFIRLERATDSPRALFDAMIALHPGRANPGSLWGGALRAKARAAA